MLKRVDIAEDEILITGYSYQNQDDQEEYVQFVHTVDNLVEIVLSQSDGFTKSRIYTDDIPNLIKALQSAYDHIKN